MERLNKLIKAFIAHELGEDLLMTDQTYDTELKWAKETYPYFNIFSYMPIDPDAKEITHRVGITELTKYMINEIADYWIEEVPADVIRLPKYDGSSIVIAYTNGYLDYIASMSDKHTGIIQTEKLRHFVPNQVDPRISFLRAEVLIDSKLITNSRGKANGLVTSKHIQEVVDELASLVVYQVIDHSTYIMKHDLAKELISVHDKWRDGGAPIFMYSPTIEEIELTGKGTARYKGFDFNHDGIVYKEDSRYWDNWSYKYYYVSSAFTPVEEIQWRWTTTEGYTSVLRVETVSLDDKTITNPTTNGVPKLIELGCGVGSIVEVVFSGMTIPKVISVQKTAPITFPTCECCKITLSADDIFGSLVKCPNPDCQDRMDRRIQWVKDTPELTSSYLKEWICYYIISYLNIARFSETKNRKSANSGFETLVIDPLSRNSPEEVIQLIKSHFNVTELAEREMRLTINPTVKVLSDILNS